MFDLLKDRFIPVTTGGQNETVDLTLPELFRELGQDRVDTFPGLGKHQAQAWYQFLAQIGAVALQVAGRMYLPRSSGEWEHVLAALTPDSASTAWSLVVEDASRPALMQPPTRVFNEYELAAITPDALDILVTSKNHDRKRAQALGGAPHFWLFSLVTLQTNQGYSGSGQLGIARMNGGHASRVLIDLRPNARWGPRICRAIKMLLNRRAQVLKNVGDALYQTRGGIALTWLEQWDADDQIALQDLDPYFIETCRRVRLVVDSNGRIQAQARKSKKSRILAKKFQGNLGDPWVPINIGKGMSSSLTVSRKGFDYGLAQRILFEKELKSPLALKRLPGEEDRDMEIHMSVLVRGQGKTEGLHERVIPLPQSVPDRLFFDDEDGYGKDEQLFAEFAKIMVALAGNTRRVVRRAILVYLQGPENTNLKKNDADHAVEGFDRSIDERYFEYLFSALANGFDETNRSWQRFVCATAEHLMKRVWSRMNAPSARREKARAASEGVLYSGLRKELPESFVARDKIESEDGNGS